MVRAGESVEENQDRWNVFVVVFVAERAICSKFKVRIRLNFQIILMFPSGIFLG